MCFKKKLYQINSINNLQLLQEIKLQPECCSCRQELMDLRKETIDLRNEVQRLKNELQIVEQNNSPENIIIDALTQITNVKHEL